VDAEQIGMLVEDVIDALEAQYDSDIPSRAIGDAVMQRLRKIDEVAYVRFASVYKEFRDVSEFMHEINGLDKKPAAKD
jgi:transcriptional repressor NrdR